MVNYAIFQRPWTEFAADLCLPSFVNSPQIYAPPLYAAQTPDGRAWAFWPKRREGVVIKRCKHYDGSMEFWAEVQL